MKISVRQIMDRLPPEAQKWVQGMTSSEKVGTEIILKNVGADSFIKHWEIHKDDLEYIRHLYGKLG